MALSVTSSLFTEGGRIPEVMVYDGFGYHGGNQSPDLAWTGAPRETKSFAITCYDPDAPTTVGFWHWVFFNLSAQTAALPLGAGKSGKNPPGTVLGYTDYGVSEYGGPAPPPGPPHRYQFTVFALGLERLELTSSATGALLMFAIHEAILDRGTLTGLYGKS